MSAAIAPSFAGGPYIYVANAGEDTVSKIDVGIPAEVARYATWFTSGVHASPGSSTCVSGYPGFPNCNYPIPHSGGDPAHEGPAPSRIARDSTGSYVYVLDRFFSTADTSGSVNGPHLPVLFKIAVSPSGTTSSGSTVLPITDTNNNNDIDVSSNETADGAIKWAKSIGTASDVTGLGRAVCTDTGGFLWVGMYRTKVYYKINPNTGNIVPGVSVSTGNHTPYGCEVDVNGKLWSVDENNTLAEFDTTSPPADRKSVV